MAGTTSSRTGNTTGYIVDAPEIRALIDEAQELSKSVKDDAERVDLLKPTFQKLLSTDGWLPDEYTQPADTTGMGGGIAAYALYRAADASLCLFAFVIPPEATTPIHDHGAWGLVGIYRGRQHETYYHRIDDGSIEGRAVLELIETQKLEAGEFYPLLPDGRDIHSVGSLSDRPTVSAHLLANDTGCARRHQFDFEAQTVKPFRSGWSNLPCDDSPAV